MGSMLCKEYKTTGKITPNPDQNSGIVRLKNEKRHMYVCTRRLNKNALVPIYYDFVPWKVK